MPHLSITKKNSPLIFPVFLSALFCGIFTSAQLRADNDNSTPGNSHNDNSWNVNSVPNQSQYNQSHSGNLTAKSPLKWLYGWSDGSLANTVGSATNNSPVPASTTYLSTGYSPRQISNAYGFSQLPAGDTGKGETIAIIVPFGNTAIQSDLNSFDAAYGIPAATVHIAYPTGTAPAWDVNWAFETDLDVEWAHAMAPGATIWLVVSTNATLSNMIACVDYAANVINANVVSMSWTMSEFSDETNWDSHFTNPNVTFVAAAGDYQNTNWPAASPYVLAVGGTTMKYSPTTGMLVSEVGWSGTNDIAIYGPGLGGGGGISQFEPVPEYQLGTTGYDYLGFKSLPDVSYDADPYTGIEVFYTAPGAPLGGWAVAGGTSIGTPQWAALAARCNWNQDATHPSGSINFIFDIYAMYFGATRDIINGSNGIFPATKWYDLATGMGAPKPLVIGQSWGIPYGTNDIIY